MANSKVQEKETYSVLKRYFGSLSVNISPFAQVQEYVDLLCIIRHLQKFHHRLSHIVRL